MKKGFTLIELLIAIGLFSVLTAIASAGFVNALRTQRQVAALISAQSNAGLALEQMTREIRTGYLFCHDPGDTAATTTCGCASTAGTLGIVGTNDQLWTCPALDFYNAQTDNVQYSVNAGTLQRSDNTQNGGQQEAITSNSVNIKSLKFLLQGQLEDDQWTPRITIIMAVSPSSTDPTFANDVLNLETSVSARTIDCNSSDQC